MPISENGGSNGNGMVMPVAPMGYGGYGMGGFGGGFGNMFGADGSWLLLLILLCNGGWGGFGGFGGFGGGFGLGMMDGGWGLYPWMNQLEATQNGFNQQTTNTTLSGIQSAVTSGFGDTALGIAGVNQNICQTGGQITAAINNTAAQAEIANGGRHSALTQQLYQNELNSLNRSFAEQTANTQGFTDAARQLADCCCENRLATANLSALVQSENCADREALSNGIRDIITAQNAGTQRIIDQLCQDKIDAKNERIASLENQVNMQNLAASQAAQTAALIADNTAQTQYVVNRVAPYPQPAYVVGYGCNGGWNGFNNGFNGGGFNGGFGPNPFGSVGFGNGSF